MTGPNFQRILVGNETVAGFDVTSIVQPDGSEWRYVRRIAFNDAANSTVVASGIVKDFRLTHFQSAPLIEPAIGMPALEAANDSTVRFLPLNSDTNHSPQGRLRFAFTFTGSEPAIPQGSRPRYYHAEGTPYYFLVHAVIENPDSLDSIKLASGRSHGHFNRKAELITQDPGMIKSYRTIAGGLVAHKVDFLDLPKDLAPYPKRTGVFISAATLTRA